ncbi:MAG: efflux RND transporter permease subunit [Chromatiales bacterium]
MMRWILGSSVQFRLLVIAFAVALMAIGIVRLRDTPVEVFPDFGPVRVELQTEALGLSPEEVENLITNPMEQEFFNGMPWLHKIRSYSLPGLSSIEMIFEPGTDPIRARQVVQERLTMTPALPQVSKPPYVIQPVATTGRLMIIGLSSKEISLIDLSVLARWKIRQRLLSVPGVANVAIWGYRDRQLQVLVDPNRLRSNGLQVDDVIRTAGNAMWSSPLTYVEASTPGTGGFIDTPNQRIGIEHIQPIKTATELALVTIEGEDNGSLTLGQVADIVENHQPLIGDAIFEDRPGVLLVVERFPGTSVSKVTRSVEQALDAMRPGLSGVQIDTTIFRAASFVEAARDNLVWSLGIGLVLLVLLIGALLANWRTALISVLTIVCSLTAAWLVLSAFGVMLNMMIVAGLVMAVAVIVDDSIVDVDNIRRRLQQHRAGGGTASGIDIIVAASQEMRGPMLWAMSIVIVSVIPVLVLGEVSGAFLKPLVLSYALAVLVSMVVALVLTPALAVALLSRESLRLSESPLAQWLGRGYSTLLRAVVHRPAWMLVVAAVVTVGGLLVMPQLGSTNLAPVLKDRDLLMRWKAAPGMSLPAMARITAVASKELRSIPGVRNVAAHLGRAVTSDLVTNVDSADLWVSIDPSADYDETVAAVNKVAEAYPGLWSTVTTYPNQRIREVTEGTEDDLVVRVYGRDYDVLRAKAETVAKTISGVDGVVSPQVKLPAVEPTVEVEVFVTKAAAKGIKPGDVRRAAAAVLSGITAGNLYEEQKIFDVVVWGMRDKRDSLTSIRELLIDTPDDSQVRLGDVADVRIRPNPSVIKRDAVSRYMDVTAQVQGRSLGAVTSDVEARLGEISFPIEHHAEVLGEAAQRQSTQRNLLGYAIAALVAVYFLLQACFSSWRLASLLFVLLPLPLAGAALAAFLRLDTLSVLALVSGLTVLAVAVRGGILQIAGYQRLEQEEGEAFGLDLVLRGSQQRFGAIVLATVAAALTLVPLLLYGSVAGQEIVAPLAAVVLGGLLAAALLNLFVLPALYLRFAAPASSEQPYLAPRPT